MAWLAINRDSKIVINTDFIVRVSYDHSCFYIIYSNTEISDSVVIESFEVCDVAGRRIAYGRLVSDLLRYCCNHKYVVLDSKTGEFNALE